MIASIASSIRRKVVLVAVATALVAVLLVALALLVYDTVTYRKSWMDSLSAQAETIGRSSAPALLFKDPDAVRDNLAVLRARPAVQAAAVYAHDGTVFARYVQDSSHLSLIPASAPPSGTRDENHLLLMTQTIMEKGEPLGTVFLVSRDEPDERLRAYGQILAVVLIGSLAIAVLLSAWLQAAVTQPVLEIARVARAVMDRHDFSLRAEKTTTDEVGVLVDAFNSMLMEVGRRTADLERSEEALLLADRRKDEFLATLAHELRNPLAPIRNSLQILRVKGDDPATVAQVRPIMERQLMQLVRLVDDLLDVSRITTGKLTVRSEPVELAGILGNAIDTTRPIIEANGHTLVQRRPASRVWINGDATRLAQVFANLLHNAAKYTPQEGRIELDVDVREATVAVAVIDNGIGIAPDMLEQVFVMFAQADQSLERAYSGLGVGLTLARRLIQLHDGTLTARSAGRGKGSAFVVTLPTIPPPHVVKSSEARTPSRNTHRLRVLAVDDNRDFVATLQQLLLSLGHDVRVAYDGNAGLEMAAGFEPHVAFLDIGMPGINGYELARRLRERAAGRDLTLVAITGWGQERDQRLAREATFDRHLIKPPSAADIEAILAACGEAAAMR
ncbi:MAG TPA: ATP-binding protein [Casimicrobiaceae bacterium]|nr:ATP-binding protein [Casimicrobiaceae bacterium]